jgi:hypothetical protein
MDPDEIKIPVPMRDAQSIYAALGSLRRIAAIEANDEFVETLDGLMARLRESHNAVAAQSADRHEELIEGSEEDRRAPPGQEPQHDSSMPQEEEDRAELLNRLYSAQTEEQIDAAAAAAERWLVERAHDEAVRLAREQAMHRRAGAPPH